MTKYLYLPRTSPHYRTLQQIPLAAHHAPSPVHLTHAETGSRAGSTTSRNTEFLLKDTTTGLCASIRMSGVRRPGALAKMISSRSSTIVARLSVRLASNQRLAPGTIHSYCSSAVYNPTGEPGAWPDRGGCINILILSRPIIKKSHSLAANSCLVQVDKWEG